MGRRAEWPFKVLKEINRQLIPAVTRFSEQMGADLYEQTLFAQCEYLVSKLSDEDLDKYLAAGKASEVMAGILDGSRGILEQEITSLAEWANMPEAEFWPLIFYPGLEIISIAFRTELVWGSQHGTRIPGHHSLVADKIMARRLDSTECTAERKVEIFKNTVELRNRFGWNMADASEVKNAVCWRDAYGKQIKRIFELNPHLSPWALVSVLWECIEWSRKGPEEKERHFWSRQGADLGTFCRPLDQIVNELGMREECAVTQL